MTEESTSTIKRIANELINISDVLKASMEKWSDTPQRFDNMSATECAGFISKDTDGPGLSLVIDVLAAEGTDTALLRIWAIETKIDAAQNERFYNIQLDFSPEYNKAREVTQKSSNITREDIRTLLNDQNTRMSHIIVSDYSGVDKDQPHLGERLDMSAEALNDEATAAKTTTALYAVLATLKESTAVESS